MQIDFTHQFHVSVKMSIYWYHTSIFSTYKRTFISMTISLIDIENQSSIRRTLYSIFARRWRRPSQRQVFQKDGATVYNDETTATGKISSYASFSISYSLLSGFIYFPLLFATGFPTTTPTAAAATTTESAQGPTIKWPTITQRATAAATAITSWFVILFDVLKSRVSQLIGRDHFWIATFGSPKREFL